MKHDLIVWNEIMYKNSSEATLKKVLQATVSDQRVATDPGNGTPKMKKGHKELVDNISYSFNATAGYIIRRRIEDNNILAFDEVPKEQKGLSYVQEYL